MKRVPSLLLGMGAGLILANFSIVINMFGSNLVMILGVVLFLVGIFLIATNKDGLGKK